MQTETPRTAPVQHRLLPHERWLADSGARRVLRPRVLTGGACSRTMGLRDCRDKTFFII
jgi:hypothetical protein